MATVFKLPLLGQTMQEGTILRWLKEEGDSVEASEPLVEVMTDKVNQEVEPMVAGIVRRRLAAEGDTVPVGAPIAIIAAADEPLDALLAELQGGDAAAATPSAEASIPAAGNGGGTADRPGRERPTADRQLETEGAQGTPAVSPRARHTAGEAGLAWQELALSGTGPEGLIVERDVLAYLEDVRRERPRMTPLAARIAAEHGVTAEGLAAPGDAVGARVRAADVRRAVTAAPAVARRAPEAPPAREWRLAGMRKVIAGRLAAIYQSAPHVPLRVEVDMTAAAALRAQLQPALAAEGGKLTYTDLIAAALARGLLAVPAMNATLEGDLVREHGAVHLGVAVALEEGLSVPVVRDAHALSLPELSAAIRDLAAGARAGKLPPDAYSGGTFTLTNLGHYGVDSFDPILNPPQVGILGTGRIADRLVAHQGAAAVRPTMHLTLTFDHRATDGAPAARLLATLKELLENPARLLL